jgi:hypothetical protein
MYLLPAVRAQPRFDLVRGTRPPTIPHAALDTGAPGRIRTADAGLRTAALYPLSYGGAADIVPPGDWHQGAGDAVSPRMPSEMTATPLPELILYTRPGCHLCEDTRQVLQGLLEDRAAQSQPLALVREVDIGGDPDLERRLFDIIPVVELGGRRLELAISAAKLRRFLAEGLDAAANRIA